ncbi:MAG: tRNA (adenosine(37)-N6)-threonylcarbamoyltransferase complex transferase subunit TsaD, partial [Bacteroidetes bacterium]|nr:tRNA (adenosine(37)-N6)-threonylcarbamoyltransferase complex transferase subunit TsaD [Bacteroidota bacterium]
QRAAVDSLVGKAIKAATAQGLERIVVAGGVGANRLLRSEIAARFPGDVFYPRPEFCTDNGAMIALAGHLRLVKGQVSAGNEITIKPRWSLEDLEEV